MSPPLLSFCFCSHLRLSPPRPPGGADAADPVLPRLPQGAVPAHLPQPGRALRAHQPAPPHGRGQEAQAQLLSGAGGVACDRMGGARGVALDGGVGPGRERRTKEEVTLYGLSGQVTPAPPITAAPDYFV